MVLSGSTATPSKRLPELHGGRIISHCGRTSQEPPDLIRP